MKITTFISKDINQRQNYILMTVSKEWGLEPRSA